MSPDTRRTTRTPLRSSALRTGPSAGEPSSGVPPLEALSAASTSYEHAPPKTRGPRTRPSVALPFVAAILVGVALASLGPFEYLSAATIGINGSGAADHAGQLKALLLQHAWSGEDAANHRSSLRVWSATLPEAGILKLIVRGTDRQHDLEVLRTTANTFLQTFSAQRQHQRQTPSAGEQVLSGFAEELEQRLSAAQSQMAKVHTDVASDPTAHQDNIRRTWATRREQFNQTRQRLVAATAELAALRSMPEPTTGMVSRRERQAGIEADLALVQDMKELRVNLTELKAQMLAVWQSCAAPLDKIQALHNELAKALAITPDDGTAESAGETARSHEEQYRTALSTFGNQWTREFTTLRQLEVDPLSANVLDAYRRIRKLLTAFLFDSGRTITSLRTDIQQISEDPRDEARLHVWRSAINRDFRKLQTAHHRFEFAATALESRDNYKLDMALRASRGLHRRSLERLEAIDRNLASTALERAKREHQQSLAEAQQKLETIRSTYDTVVAQLIAIQDELSISAGLSEEFLKQSLQLELSKHDLDLVQGTLATTTQQLNTIEAQRLAQLGDINLTLLDCAVIDGPSDLAKRFKLGSEGALITLLVVGLGSWWLTRRG